MRTLSRSLRSLALVAGLSFLASGASSQETYVLRLANFGAATGAGGQIFEAYARELVEASGGRLKLELFHGASMGPAEKHFDLVRSGVADIGYFSLGYTPGRFPRADIFTLPNVIRNARTDGDATEILMKLAPQELYPEFDGVKMLWLAAISVGSVYTASAPIRTLDDLKGKELRVTAKSIQAVFREVGAVPVSLNAGEVADALQKRTIDGIHGSRGALWTLKAGDLVRYETPLLKADVLVGLAINQAAYNRLPTDLRALIDSLGGTARAVHYVRAFEQDNPAVVEYFSNRHLETIVPDPSLTAAIDAAADAYNQSVLSGLDPELRTLYDRIRELDKAGS